MNIAHITDVHWMHPPPLARLPGKRLLGTANLYLRGRRHRFTEAVQDALVAHVVALAPDVVVCTGDLTAQALPEEFAKARSALEPILTRFPTLVMPGNHDVYTRGAARDHRIEEYFGEWMGLGGAVARLQVADLTVLALDPNRPTGLHASGRVPDAQLEALAAALADPGLEGRRLILALHYPILDRHGEIYDSWAHGLRNARDLIDVLRAAPRRPEAILHGHEHHGFHVDLDLGGDRVPIYDCGSSGYAWVPAERRAAAMNTYVLDADGVRVERYLYDGEGFSPEPGGAYATGR